MASSFYDKSDKSVTPLTVARARDLNTINDAVDAGFVLTEAAIGISEAAAEMWAELAEDYAEKPEDTEITLGEGNYSALHHSAKASAQRVLAETARTWAETARTGAQTAQGLAEDAQDAAETAQGLSEDARDLAQEWAESDLVITGTIDSHSAKYYSEVAEAQVPLVQAEGTTQIGLVQAAGGAELLDIANAGDAELADIAAAGDAELLDIANAGDTEIAAVQAEGTTQVGLVTAEGTTQVGLVEDEGDTQVARVIAEGTTQETRVTTEGTEQIGLVEAAADAKIVTMNGLVDDAEAAQTAAELAETNAETAETEAESHKDLAYQYTQDAASAVAYQNLAGINQVLASSANIVDVFIYDTSKDSDGGAWRKRCQNTSWYNEPLNTATRGFTREFPAVALIVAETKKLTIYDATDPDCPMWMVFNIVSFSSLLGVGIADPTINSISAVNGIIARTATKYDVVAIDFIKDTGANYLTSSKRNFNGNILQRHEEFGWVEVSSVGIINRSCNDVAMTVLDNAPIDQTTGLPVPTIAVGTDGNSTYGLSLITHDGSVYDIGADTAGTTFVSVSFDGPRLTAIRDDGNVYVWDDVSQISADGVAPDMTYSASTTPALLGTAAETVTGKAVASTTGLTVIKENQAEPAKGMVAFITDSYNSGFQVGDIKGSFLADTTEETITSADTEQDRSVNANHLQVVGELTKAPVAAGAELVGYSGFSAANYIELTDADFADTLFACGWQYNGTAWEFKSGVVSTAPLDGVSITGTTLHIEGTYPKALIRLTNGTPSADQLTFIEQTEKKLFEENAKCTLQGSASVVSLAYDETTKKLTCVSSTGGLSQFQDLLMVNSIPYHISDDVAIPPTTPWKVAAVHDDKLLYADSARVYYDAPAYNLREELERKNGIYDKIESLSKSDVGLSNVDNTSDLNKPISTAAQTALDDKLEISSIDNIAVDGELLAPISSNWAYDHENGADPHSGVYEPDLGDPATDGYILTSTAAGVRSWTEMAASIGLPSITAGDAEKILRVNAEEDGYDLEALPFASESEATTGTETAKMVSPATTLAAIRARAIPLPPSGVDVTGNIYGFNLSKTGANQVTVSKGSCLDSTLTVPLALTADTAVAIPAVANTIYHVFVVKLVADGSMEVRAYTSEAAVASDGTVDKWRWVGWWKTGGSSECVAMTNMGEYYLSNKASDWVVSSGITTTFATVDHSAFIPESRVELIEYGATGSTTSYSVYASDDGTNTSIFIGNTAVANNVGIQAWGHFERQKTGLKPFLASRRFCSSSDTSHLLIHAVKVRR